MAMTHEEELSELATKVTFYALGVAALLAFAVDQACAHGWGCAVAHVLPKIPYYLAILVPLLLPPAIVLFFVRAAGSSTKAADGKSISVKDVDFSMVLLLLLLLSTIIGTINFAFYKYGYPCDLLGHVALFFIFLCEALVYVRAALAQWMNPKPSNMVAAD
ncbi:hypothetical protein VPH35_120417 [Triticum aestivum]|uniref:uncharacterized protein n=1 Tax=Triticum aestivum TaxID=4565 RepID=UPI000845640E|nr:uncharacterized protein LOC123147496 [Triticum aestivum]XP_044422698.1 uncharacterized protein LOC123147496 [Triticum aestivum]XP_044422700.1 uncharacterized protein LOC123147496 [Triticum aestivum]XP_044422701.1 uncharacterized protein LOC123147496 [Triticum aestivum]